MKFKVKVIGFILISIISISIVGCSNSNQEASVTTESTMPIEQTTEDLEYIEQLLKDAEQGDVESQFLLGLKYVIGGDVEQNYQKAIEWFTKAAEQGHNEAQIYLGDLYQEQKDYKKAIEWFTKAAEQGHNEAHIFLGDLYQEQKDYKKALEWYTKAFEQGDKSAKTRIESLNLTIELESLDEVIKSMEKSPYAESTKNPTTFSSAKITESSSESTTSSGDILKAGTYRVGKDIPAGEYVVTPNEGYSGYYEVSADSSGDSIITNEVLDGQDYITVEDGQYFQIKNATAKLAD